MVVINDLTLNQDCSCISISTSEYHKIFNCEPFGEFYSSQNQKHSVDDTLGPNSTSEPREDETVDSNKEVKQTSPAIPKRLRTPTVFLKLLFSTSLTIIVPQSQSKLGNRLLKIYNLKQNLKICELTFPSNIVNVRLNRKRLLVFLEIGQIYVYDLSCVRLIKVLEINSYIEDLSISGDSIASSGSPELVGELSPDDKGLLFLPISAINDQTDIFNGEGSTSRPNSQPSTPLLKPSDSTAINHSLDSIIAFIHKSESTSSIAKKFGYGITLEDLKKDSSGWILVYDTINLKPLLIFKAHNSAIAKISVSRDSSRVATASVKGTIVRVFKLVQNEDKLGISQVTNLRRGHNLARINCLSFNGDNTILGCGSENNTIHLFWLSSEYEQQEDDVHQEQEGDDTERENDSDENNTEENLNDNLASLLVEKQKKESKKDEGSYFGFNFKKTSKLINNHYTKSIIKKLPYREYFDNLIWEPPRRSFAYIKLPEYTPPTPDSGKKVELGFNGGLILLASYQTGIFYQYQLPKEKRAKEERHECYLVNQYTLV